MGRCKRFNETLYVDIDTETYESITTIASLMQKPIAEVCRLLLKLVIPGMTQDYMIGLISSNILYNIDKQGLADIGLSAGDILPVPSLLTSLLTVRALTEGKCL